MPEPRPQQPAAADWPGVSLIVLGTDAEAAGAVVEELLARPYPGEFEILLAAPEAAGHPALPGPLDELAARDPRVAVIHGKGTAAAALVNAAGFAASHPILSEVRPASAARWVERLRRAVEDMDVTGADVVGGAAVAVGLGSAELAMSRAINSRIGVGPRASRAGAARGPVDSVRMVAIRREAFERVGGFDPAFLGAQDWELQHRVRQGGGMVWLDPALAEGRRAPGTVRELAAAFFRTGAWRRRVIAAHADTSSWRYLMPPVLVLAMASTLAAGAAGVALGIWQAAWLALFPLVYAVGVAVGVASAGRELNLGGRARMWWAVIVIHLAWGAGFLFGRRGRAGGPQAPPAARRIR
jgi:hypothetical protein